VGVDGVRKTMEEHTKHFTDAELVELEHTVLCALKRLCIDTPTMTEKDAKLKLDAAVMDGMKRVYDLRANAHTHYTALIEQIKMLNM